MTSVQDALLARFWKSKNKLIEKALGTQNHTISSTMRKQKICFIRHGVAKHNVKDPLTGAAPNLKSPLFFDPHLLYDGKRMALEAGERLKRWWQTTQLGEDIELVITSPLTRCIQTTMFAFLPGDCYTSNENTRQEPKLYCTELVREAFGMHYPDRRRDLTVLKVSTFTSLYCNRQVM